MSKVDSRDEQFSEAVGSALVFDSGVGGLTVVEALRALCPKIHIDYAADTGFFPYGEKSDTALKARLPDAAAALVEVARPDVFVIACNTASTLALSDVRCRLSCPVVGTVPAIKPAAAASRTKTIGLLATPGTIRRAYTANLIREYAPDARIILKGSLQLVALAEAVARGETPPMDAFAEAQRPLFEAEGGEKMDTIVLACTHFPLVRAQLEKTAPRPVTYIDSGDAIARQTARILLDLCADTPKRVSQAFVTDAQAGQSRMVKTFARFGLMHTSCVHVQSRGGGVTQPSSKRSRQAS